MEVMEALFQAMPAGEKIWMDWACDETTEFFLRFSNGWSLGQHTSNPEEPETMNWEHPGSLGAPAWFPRSRSGLLRWKQWHSLLHCYTIDPGVDGLAQERLHALAEKRGGLSAQDLPLIRETLVGPVFGAGLASIRLDEALDPPANAKRTSKSRM